MTGLEKLLSEGGIIEKRTEFEYEGMSVYKLKNDITKANIKEKIQQITGWFCTENTPPTEFQLCIHGAWNKDEFVKRLKYEISGRGRGVQYTYYLFSLKRLSDGRRFQTDTSIGIVDMFNSYEECCAEFYYYKLDELDKRKALLKKKEYEINKVKQNIIAIEDELLTYAAYV